MHPQKTMLLLIAFFLSQITLVSGQSLDDFDIPDPEPVRVIAPVSPIVNPPEPEPEQPEEPSPQEAPVIPNQDDTTPSDSTDEVSDWERAFLLDLWVSDSTNIEKFRGARLRTFWAIGLWLGFVFILLIYLFTRFHFWGGLGRKAYKEQVQIIDADAAIPLSEKVEYYPQNPYKMETLGLPKGTVRGTLTLTLLVANCLVLYLGSYAPPTGVYRQTTEFITTAFLMMIAFYFGSKAVEVFRERETSRRKTLKADSVVPVTAQPRSFRHVAQEQRPATHIAKEVAISTGSAAVKLVTPALPSITNRALRLTTFFETGKTLENAAGTVAGDFDNMGISLGILQWNLGMGTLQPILRNFFDFGDPAWKNDPNLVKLEEILDLPTPEQQVAWARTIQSSDGRKFTFLSDWEKSLTDLGEMTVDFQIKACKRRFKVAAENCRQLGLFSERAFALLFDINVQNGVLYATRRHNVRQGIERRMSQLANPGNEEEVLKIIAEERAKASLPRWQNDVRSRKLAIAMGTGTVHRHRIDLDDFAISLSRDWNDTFDA